MSNPKISVIIPVYNAESTLRRCVDSVLAQTFTDFECLLINDGSKDKSGEICDEYAIRDSRIKVFHKENGGVSSARNVGLDNATGEWIAFVDSDDWVGEKCTRRGLRILGGLWCWYKLGNVYINYSKSTPLAQEPFSLSHRMTAKSLGAIGEIGGPRCCKRDSFLSILSAIDFVKENFGVEMEKAEIVCNYSSQNNQCIGKRCPFAKINHN